MSRIDTHHHLVPPFYRAALRKAGIDEAGGRALPEWSADASLEAMDALGVSAAILSVSTPGTTFLTDGGDAVALARDLNDHTADLVAKRPSSFGFFATVPLPHRAATVAESIRALDELHADGVVLLANSAGVYLGEMGYDELFAALDARSARVFIHPGDLPGPAIQHLPPFAADFLLDTTRAAYLLVRNGIRQTYPNIRFILSHGGGFVPYASHRMSLAISADTGRSLADILDEFATFYFDTALSSSPAALPSLLAFAKRGHITFGSDWPFAPLDAAKWFSTNLDTYTQIDTAGLAAINETTAMSLFPRFVRPVE
ncbi:amidohydrolase family protein [Mycobacterium sp. D16R24]|uniref:amidohydrolase family protein n=1 Tax=Mycobacterium sp. D16R24 TaxID=1855656 RepID=UPI000993D3A8|nr:amidohydrolase family protein [Mycobacterium sp. D16R24]